LPHDLDFKGFYPGRDNSGLEGKNLNIDRSNIRGPARCRRKDKNLTFHFGK
jgi:hypothetical protein